MTALLVANVKTESTVADLAALPEDDRRFAGGGAQRLLWFVRDGDIVIMPRLPDTAFFDYVTGLTGTRRSSVRLVIPPAGRFGADLLSRDRLLHPDCVAAVREAAGGRRIDRVLAMCGDRTVATLAEALGAESAMPGFGLAAAGGVTLINGKSLFRAIAGGIGVPMPPGWIGDDQQQAGQIIATELAAGHSVMIKQDLQSGGKGNEVLSPEPGLRVVGTKAPAVVLPDVAAVERYLSRRWTWLTGSGRHPIAIERYFTDAVPIFAEFMLDDDGSRLTGHAEMLMTPTYAGVIAPAPGLTPQVKARFLDSARRVCAPFGAMGYRGTISTDALLTNGDRFWFSEVNCRMGGSSHVHSVLGDEIVGPEHRDQRVLAERTGWRAPSFCEAARRLETAGLAYDPGTRLGVVITCDLTAANGTVRCCVVAEGMDAVRKYEQLLATEFPVHPPVALVQPSVPA